MRGIIVIQTDPAQAPEIYDAVVIGAGQAGLATGFHLRQAGQSFVIVDGSEGPGGSWKHYYRSLRLFSPARFSSLPGMPFPGDPNGYPSRDATIDYLQRYAAAQRLPVLTGHRVTSVHRRDDGLFEVLAGGRTLRSRSVVAASGSFERPRLPALAGQAQFQGQILHSLAYTDATAWAGKRVIVVGAANSGVQIAAELARVAKVTLAARRPPSLIRQRLLGADVHFWWWLFGLDTAETNTWQARIFKQLHSKAGPAVLDAGIYRQALASGKPELRPMFREFTRHGVVWPDGSTEPIDAVIFATGFSANLDYLAELGALNEQGQPRQARGVSTSTPGVYYVGLSYQRTYASATLRGVGPDAELVVSHLRQYVAQQARHAPMTEAHPVGRHGPVAFGPVGAIDNQRREA